VVKAARVAGLLLALQASLVAGWWAVERARTPVPRFEVEALDELAPPLPDPAPVDGRPALVHFWATWCAPCREELPSLLEAARNEHVALLAVTDEPGGVVARFFGGEIPPEVVTDAAGAATRWSVSGLPDTFAVEQGRIVARIGGPRDWSTPQARRWLRGLTGDGASRRRVLRGVP
jgi:thiol-disulfide isomerase/thioredoxin